MKTINVQASSSYNVHIAGGLLKDLANYTKEIRESARIAIISDSSVWPLYGPSATVCLNTAGYEVCHFVFPAGELSKNGNTYLQILNFLAENHITRSDLLIALGGGVVGDITGFAAATYLRGIPFIQIPTTLLAMVDSSVGGKTAIDLAAGKNLAGAFYQPSMVIFDTDTLSTLPEEYFADGMAEVIKYAMIKDEDLEKLILAEALDIEEIVERCVKIKRDVVNA
ncbi:MAG: 3-dehydroquinate synthase, partial [Oscillospiraceae bacterium]|nr:3-dehydroquinate synthase [Oscillospiraceae bacterium]